MAGRNRLLRAQRMVALDCDSPRHDRRDYLLRFLLGARDGADQVSGWAIKRKQHASRRTTARFCRDLDGSRMASLQYSFRVSLAAGGKHAIAARGDVPNC